MSKGIKGFQKGHPSFITKEAIEEIRKRMKGNKFALGKIPWNKGTKGIVKPWNKGRHPDYMQGKNHWNWKGGKKITKFGYALAYQPNHPFAVSGCYVFEHRLIVEKHLRRYLKPSEKIHHLGKKDDNRPEMLMAFINHSAHRRFEKNPNNIKLEEIIFDGRKL